MMTIYRSILTTILLITCFLAKGALAMELKSTAFSPGKPIPIQYSCDGSDISLPLEWTDPPAGVKSFALVMDDPDAPAGTWDHWLVFNIPATVNALAEDTKTLPAGSKWGASSWGRNQYNGPCPPHAEHHYHLKLYALDITLNLPEGANKQQLETAMTGHTLAKAELIGTYNRK